MGGCVPLEAVSKVSISPPACKGQVWCLGFRIPSVGHGVVSLSLSCQPSLMPELEAEDV